MRRKLFIRVLAVTISALIMCEPFAGLSNVYAADTISDVNQEVSESSENVQESATEGSTEESITEEDAENTVPEEGAEDTVTEEGSQDSLPEESIGDSVPEESAGDSVEEEGIEEPILVEDTSQESELLAEENEVTGMPDNFVLSSAQMKEKETLKSYLPEIIDAEEGVEYVSNEVIFLAPTEEEAEEIATAYDAKLISYVNTVAVIQLNSNQSVVSTMKLASSNETNLPAVWPNYFRFSDGDNSVMLYQDPLINSVSGSNQWFHHEIGSAYAWSHGITGDGVKVAVLDTGVREWNTELIIVGQEDFSTNDKGELKNYPEDVYGHGTHVSGIIAARSNNIGGCGVAPKSEIYNFKVMQDDGSGKDSDILAGMQAALDPAWDIDIVNMSLGSPQYNPLYQDVADKLYNAGITVVASAGNNCNNNPNYPAALKHVISVGATNKGGARAYFSSYGSTVDVAAPGEHIFSTSFSAPGGDIEYLPEYGTSMAAPMVTAEIALILSAKLPQLEGKTGQARVNEIERIVKSNVSPIDSSNEIGTGVINIPKALKVTIESDKPLKPVINSSNPNNSADTMLSFTSEPGTTVYYTLDGSKPDISKQTAGLTKYEQPKLLYEKKSYTVKAIAVNISGVQSSVVSKTIKLKPRVERIAISGKTTILRGSYTQLKAETFPEGTKGARLAWRVEPESKEVRVSTSGVVRISKKANFGIYKIYALATDGSNVSSYAEITVPREKKIKEIKIINSVLNLSVNSENINTPISIYDQMDVVPEYADIDIWSTDFEWTSSNTKVATINKSGALSIHKAGKITVTATSKDIGRKKATWKVNIKRLADSIVVNSPTGDDTVKLEIGKSLKLLSTISPSDTSIKNVKWTVSPMNAGVTVNKGVVKASSNANGEYIITASTLDNSNLRDDIKLQIKVVGIKKISVSNSKVTLFRTEGNYNSATSAEITASFEGELSRNTDILISNSNPNVVMARIKSYRDHEVTIELIATGTQVGNTSVKVYSTDGGNCSVTCKVQVINPPSYLTIGPKKGYSYLAAKGSQIPITASLQTDFGKISNAKLRWEIKYNENDPYFRDEINESRENNYITVSKDGVVKVDKRTKNIDFKVYAYAMDNSGAYAEFGMIVVDELKTMSIYGVQVSDGVNVLTLPIDQVPGIKRVGNKFVCSAEEVLGNEVCFVLDVNGERSYAKEQILGADISAVISTVSSNPKKTFSVQEDYLEDIPNTGMMRTVHAISVVFWEKGTSTITVEPLDGSHKKQKFTFIVK